MAEIKSALYAGLYVICCFMISQWNPERSGVFPCVAPIEGYHEMRIHGWNDDKARVVNSWGRDWGKDGTCLVSWGDVLRCNDVIAIQPPKYKPVHDETTMRRTLRKGMRGDDVKELQDKLSSYGYGCGVSDGVFGTKTDVAVRAFQTAHSLTSDGIVGTKTWAVIRTSGAPSTLALELVEYALSHVGDLYVWGACGQRVENGDLNGQTFAAFAKAQDMTNAQAERSIACYKKKLKAGQNEMYCYDCSGLISVPLIERGFCEKKRNCNHLYAMCTTVCRSELIEGDLIFRRRTDGSAYHVGVYVGRGRVVEAMGRDDGVVCRGINASGYNYWTDCGRIIKFYG